MPITNHSVRRHKEVANAPNVIRTGTRWVTHALILPMVAGPGLIVMEANNDAGFVLNPQAPLELMVLTVQVLAGLMLPSAIAFPYASAERQRDRATVLPKNPGVVKMNKKIYIHDIPGRLRIRTEALKKNERAAAAVQELLRATPGVLSTEANSLTGSIILSYDATLLNSAAILDIFSKLGYLDTESKRFDPHAVAAQPSFTRTLLVSAISRRWARFRYRAEFRDRDGTGTRLARQRLLTV